MQVKFTKDLYPKEAVLKAAQFFTDRYYMSLDVDERYYYVDIEPINGVWEENIEKQFANEALTQSARYKVMQETKEILAAIEPGQSIGIFIGPEGGFEEKEVAAAIEEGAKPITLGRRILRTETAGLAILSVLMFQLEN